MSFGYRALPSLSEARSPNPEPPKPWDQTGGSRDYVALQCSMIVHCYASVQPSPAAQVAVTEQSSSMTASSVRPERLRTPKE